MYKIESISVFHCNNFKERIHNIRTYEPNIKIITNEPNDLEIEVFNTQHKYQLIEHRIKKNKNKIIL